MLRFRLRDAGCALLLLCFCSFQADVRSSPEERTLSRETSSGLLVSTRSSSVSSSLESDDADISGDHHQVRGLGKIIVTVFIPKTLRPRLSQTQTTNIVSRADETYFSLVEDGWTTPVKDQGAASCASAWVHAAISVLEGESAKRLWSTPVVLSRQAALDCINSALGPAYADGHGCNGGYVEDVFRFLTQYSLPVESAYPYTSGRTGKTGPCQKQWINLQATNASQRLSPVSFVRGATFDSSSLPWYDILDIKDPKKYISAVTRGPLVTFWNINNKNRTDLANPYDNKFLAYVGGVYDGSGCASDTNINHAMMLVGYCSDATPPYWIFQNSWGTSWGEAGFIRVLMMDTHPGTCGMYRYSLTPAMLYDEYSAPPSPPIRAPAPSHNTTSPKPGTTWQPSPRRVLSPSPKPSPAKIPAGKPSNAIKAPAPKPKTTITP